MPKAAPLTLRIAVWLLAAEAVALAVLAVVLLASGDAQSGQGAAGVIGYVAVFAVALGVLSWALHGRRATARSAAIVAHMFLLPLGIAVTAGGQWPIGVVCMAVGIGGCVVLLAPATRSAVGRG